MTKRYTPIAWGLLMCLLLGYATMATAATDREEISRLMADADSLHAMGQSEEAITLAGEAAALARHDGDSLMILSVNASLGVYLRSTGQIDEALACYGTALEIVTSAPFRENPDEEAIEGAASLYINLATLHTDLQHREEAIRYARSCAEWTALCTDRAMQAQIYGAIGLVMTTSGQPEESMQYHALAYRYALETGDRDSALRAAAYTLQAGDRLGHMEEAETWRRTCRELLDGEGVNMMARLAYLQIECSICLRRGNSREAIAWFDSILGMEGIQNLPFVVYDCYNNLHQSYADLDRYDSAYSILLRSNALRDSLFEQQKVESMRELTVKYDAKEKELALALSEASRANMRFRLALSLAALALMGAAFALYAMGQRRRRHERELEFATMRRDTERQLTSRYVEGLENERTRMARELHDGVCNDLTAIQMRLGEDNPTSPALPLLATCREQVRRISHEMMPLEFSYATIDEVLRYYIYKLDRAQTACRLAYTSLPAGADWQAVPNALALEIYRIVQEATGNAVKHAGATDICVSMTRTAGGIELTVTDNGTPRPSQSQGIGLRTMRQRAAATGGSLSVESHDGGTTVRFTLELKVPETDRQS